MDVNFSVALDSPPQERDFFVAAGDYFRVIVTVYAADKDDGTLPISLTGKTLTFEMRAYPAATFTAAGNIFTFDGTFPSTPYRRRRRDFRIVMTDDATGQRTTLCFGHMVIPNMDGDCWRWGNGYGSDYGWL